jgi:hypothetical protein
MSHWLSSKPRIQIQVLLTRKAKDWRNGFLNCAGAGHRECHGYDYDLEESNDNVEYSLIIFEARRGQYLPFTL